MMPPKWIELLILGISFVLHELGHVVLMQRLKIFKGLKIHWYWVECEIDKEAKVDISFLQGVNLYLVGFFASLIPMPIWVFSGGVLKTFIMYQVIAASMDFFYCLRMILKYGSFKLNEGME